MKILIVIIIICCCVNATAQNTETDSLKKLLAVTANDTSRIIILESLSYAHLSYSPDTALKYALEGLHLAQKIKYRRGEAVCLNALGNVYFHIGDNAKALELYLRYLKLKESIKDFRNISVAYYNLASVYTLEKNYRHALHYLFKAKAVDEQKQDSAAILYDLYSLGSAYLHMGMNDSALYYTNECYKLVETLDDKNMMPAVLNTFGEIYFAKHDSVKAAAYYKQSMPYAEAINDYEVMNANYYGLAKVYKQKGMLDSSVYYARKAFATAKQASFFRQTAEIGAFISDIFKTKKNYDSAFHYQELTMSIKDSLFNEAQAGKVQELKFQEEERQQAIDTARLQYKHNITLFIIIFTLIILVVIILALWHNNKQKKRANVVLEYQKNKVKTTLQELRATQTQLIQSEKMASLGELTAGIAHEIQNPLNFVNNFSEVNKEMLEELKTERLKQKAERDEQLENDLINDLISNEAKINHHGKRADSIVKGMLQHSRVSTGQKEPTDINVLCDEYLRLSYHGFRAKDKNFNADHKTDFDESIGKINIVPQDIGRVLLNLFNNAFYAVKPPNPLKGEQYKPLVSVTTRKLHNTPSGDGGIEIIVKDNGNGIPQNIVDKIFQPFFTTKPTGQGTGLGLSLAYDIIKAHGGEIKVETKEGEGSEFVIQLPV